MSRAKLSQQWSDIHYQVTFERHHGYGSERSIAMQAQGWMDDLQIYVLINSMSVISGRLAPLIMKGCVQWTPFMVERGMVDESPHQDLRCFKFSYFRLWYLQG